MIYLLLNTLTSKLFLHPALKLHSTQWCEGRIFTSVASDAYKRRAYIYAPRGQCVKHAKDQCSKLQASFLLVDSYINLEMPIKPSPYFFSTGQVKIRLRMQVKY